MKFVGRMMAGMAAALAVAWLCGFAWFAADIARTARTAGSRAMEKADGIVVLTGGADRIATGMRLLHDGCCGRLLISGVGHGAALEALLRGSGVAADPIGNEIKDGQITLGRAATSTAGNADETAAWAHANHLHSLIVVTAYYHMPRALFELSRTAPDLLLIPAPVQPPAARGAGSLAMLPLLAHEYTKFLGSAVGLTLLEHVRDPALDRKARKQVFFFEKKNVTAQVVVIGQSA
jgi:uncharacterized SAM-binding protein YcdF (DUF218 family)